MTAIAWTEGDPVVLSKAMSKFMKDNADIYTFKTGVVDGKLIDSAQLTTIANLPSKEELISKLLFVLNAQAQRIVTVINAVPRDLAVVIKQIGDKEGRAGDRAGCGSSSRRGSSGSRREAGEPAAAEAGSGSRADEAATEAAEKLSQRPKKQHRQQKPKPLRRGRDAGSGIESFCSESRSFRSTA